MRPKRILSLDKVALEIDLEKLFGKKIVDAGLRRNIAESLISTIEQRTAGGQGVNGNGSVVDLKSPYSKEYAESVEFKAFGKKQGKINMKLTGSMLASIDMIDESPSRIEIGINNEEAPKAYNHMVGDTVPSRPFLGLTAEDLDKVKEEYADQTGDAITVKDIFDRNRFADLARIIMGSNKIGFKP